MTQDDLLYNGNLKALAIGMPVSKLPKNKKMPFSALLLGNLC